MKLGSVDARQVCDVLFNPFQKKNVPPFKSPIFDRFLFTNYLTKCGFLDHVWRGIGNIEKQHNSWPLKEVQD